LHNVAIAFKGIPPPLITSRFGLTTLKSHPLTPDGLANESGCGRELE
jgi:hypothetical protein